MANTDSGLTGKIGGLLQSVPGYRGYKSKEERRDSDRRVRERVATAFAGQAERVERVGSDLANQRRLRDIGPVDEFAQTIRHLIDRISTATYGYGGLFSDRNVDEHALDQLRLFDESLLASVNELDAPITALEQALAANTDLTAPTRTGVAATRTILARLDLRDDVIETGRPVPDDKIQDILSPKPKEEQGPPPAYNLKSGDALSVLGDNFVVDGQINLDVTGRQLRLHRVGQSPERWLLVPADRGQSFALLSATDDAFTPGSSTSGTESTIGDQAYTVNWSGRGSGQVSGRGGSIEGRSVTVTSLTGKTDPATRALVLDWDNEHQVLTGNEVVPDDVEIYGSTSK